MKATRVKVLAGAAVLTAAVAACGPAGTAPGAGRSAAQARSHPSAMALGPARAGGAVHLTAYSINSDGPYFRAIVTGAVGDFGPAVTVFPDGKVDPNHTSQIELKLSRGTFRLDIAALDAKIVSAFGHWRYNRDTCSGQVDVSAAAPVVRHSGTGSYHGIGGTLTMAAVIEEVDAPPCSAASTFISQVIVLTGSGTVSFR